MRAAAAVTGYWKLTTADDADNGNLRTGPNGYLKNMPVVMTLNVPMAIYGDAFGLKNMQRSRGNATPAFLSSEEVPLASLGPCKDHSREMRAKPMRYTDPKDAPSVSLGCIWDGKMSLLAKTARAHPGFKWYMWVDVGMHAYKMDVIRQHGGRPWPNEERLASLPPDKISVDRTFACQRCRKGDWDNFCHCIAATTMLFPASVVQEAASAFYDKMEECFVATRHSNSSYTCLSEQHILTQMQLEKPELFHFVGKGYGNVAANLTTEAYGGGTGGMGLFDFLSSDMGEVTSPL